MSGLRRFGSALTLGLSAAAVCAVAVLCWSSRTSKLPLAQRRPGMDRPADAAQPPPPAPFLRGVLRAGPGAPGAGSGAWPQFRGPMRDGINRESVRLARQWPAGGPPVLWRLPLGEGYAAAAVRDGRVYILDYDQQAQADTVRCLSLDSGEEIWRFSYPLRIKRNHGMSRTVPAVTERHVVTFSPKCHVVCLDARTGAFQWGVDLVQQYGAEVPQWYAGQCPLVDGDRVILGVGGRALMIALDVSSGRLLWQAPNPRGWKMTHSSVMAATLGGQKTYVYAASGGVVGVAAEDGRLLWETDAWKIAIATVASPVVVGEDRLFLSGGYNAGSLMLQVHKTEDGWTAKPLFRLPPTVFGATQHTPIFYNGYLYGVRPDGQLTCLDANGRLQWCSGPKTRFGLGPFVIGDGLIFVLDDNGLLTLVEATPTAYRPLAQARVLNGPDAWGPLALVSGRLLARDFTQMVCLDVSERS